jgi:hypothetical protein
MVVAQGNRLKERESALTFYGDYLSLVDRSGKAPSVTLGYGSIVGAYYSKSKQPRWRRTSATEEVARVDLGKMSFFRSERNWLILTTRNQPVFIAFDDSDLPRALLLVEERTGLRVLR